MWRKPKVLSSGIFHSESPEGVQVPPSTDFESQCWTIRSHPTCSPKVAGTNALEGVEGRVGPVGPLGRGVWFRLRRAPTMGSLAIVSSRGVRI